VKIAAQSKDFSSKFPTIAVGEAADRTGRGMNLLSSLRYLVALDEHRHLARAAQACRITQPALSNALRALEEEFEVVIVRQGRTFVGFTPKASRCWNPRGACCMSTRCWRSHCAALRINLPGA